MKYLFALAAVLSYAQETKPAATADPVVLTVGSQKITKSEFEQLLSTIPPQQRAAGDCYRPTLSPFDAHATPTPRTVPIREAVSAAAARVAKLEKYGDGNSTSRPSDSSA